MTNQIPKGWEETNLDNIAHINPFESLTKGTNAKSAPMDCINPFTRSIDNYYTRPYRSGMKFRNGDTLMARITPCLENGKTAYVNFLNNDEVGFGSTEYIVIREKNSKSDSKFLYYFSISPHFREVAIKLMTGTSGRQRVQTDLLINYNFLFPPLPEQKAIAAVLSSFDDKIELLREENKTLEKMAQTIFKEWFVNFKFPGYEKTKMVDSELGKIPEGWNLGRLRDIMLLFDSKRVPLSSEQRAKRRGKYPYYGATRVMDYLDEFIFDGIHLLLAEDGSVIDELGFPVLQYVYGQFWVNNHAHVIQGKEPFTTEYLYLLLKRTPVSGIITGAVQLKINQENLNSIPLIIPPAGLLNQFNEVSSVIFHRLRTNESTINKLAQTRDVLLPKLMNGEIRVN